MIFFWLKLGWNVVLVCSLRYSITIPLFLSYTIRNDNAFNHLNVM